MEGGGSSEARMGYEQQKDTQQKEWEGGEGRGVRRS